MAASQEHVRTHRRREGGLAERVHTRGWAPRYVDCTVMCRVTQLPRAGWQTGLFVLALHVLTSSSFRL